MKKRAIKVAVISVILLVCGLCYGWLCMTTGVAVPCVFYKITGYSCPGCGVSRMCINLMKGNIPAAIRCNPALFFCLFPMIAVMTDCLIRYIKCGDGKPRKWQNTVLYALIVILLVHGVWRNVVSY